MKASLITIGQKMPAWISNGFEDYQKRLSKIFPLKLIEIRMPQRTKNTVIEKVMKEEAQLILEKISDDTHIITLDEHGDMWNTLQLSQYLAQWKMQAKEIAFIIGGPDGLSQEILERSHQSWSLSRLTFPHPIVRVLVAEQLYRASSILMSHPYHRA